MNVAVIGLGKLGLPLAALHSKYNRVYGIDTNERAVKTINNGGCPIDEKDLAPLVAQAVQDGRLTAHTDFDPVSWCEMTMIIVPTPSGDDGKFTNKYVLDALVKVGKALRKQQGYHTVVIVSTVMPGSCDGEIAGTLELNSDRRVGGDLGLVYSPEFIALGSVLHDMQMPDMLLIGESDERAGDMYMQVARQVVTKEFDAYFTNLVNAELAKIAINTYVTMKISFANMIGQLCERLPGANANDVTEAVGMDSRIGAKYLKPGVSFGGPCFPRDNTAFGALLHDTNVYAPLPYATDIVNKQQILRVQQLIRHTGRDRVAIFGLAYKPGTTVVEESFGMKLAEALLEDEYEVLVYDPKVSPAHIPDLLRKGAKYTTAPVGIGNDIVTVLATPDPDFAALFPKEFHDRPKSIVIDPWEVVPEGPWEETNVIRLGVGPC